MQLNSAGNTSLLLKPEFSRACHDYFYLVDRGFPERGALKLVGDRYRLSGDERTVLYRGISSRKKSELRKSLIINNIKNKDLHIDSYNVLFTLLNYRLGKLIFISTDGILRDAGSLHGKFRDHNIFNECVDQLIEYLKECRTAQLNFFFDAPVSHSQKHAEVMNEKLQKTGLKGDCRVIKSADWALKQYQHGLLATSDTAIIEKALLPVVDLPIAVLNRYYHPGFLNIRDLILKK